jgi:hypothetical protein
MVSPASSSASSSDSGSSSSATGSASPSRSASPNPASHSSPTAADAIKRKNLRLKPGTLVGVTGESSVARNEGQNTNWGFKPPAGSVLVNPNADFAEFDWDGVKDDEDIELWLVRAPSEVCPIKVDG